MRDSFILAVNQEGLWIIDQHVAHERVLFERVLRQRRAESIPVQKLLMPMVVELTPGQQAVFAEISDELRLNGFEVELFGSRTVVVKAVPAGVESCEIEQVLGELAPKLKLGLMRVHRMPRCNQNQHASCAEQDGVAVEGAGRDRVPDVVSARPSRCTALFCQGHSAGL